MTKQDPWELVDRVTAIYSDLSSVVDSANALTKETDLLDAEAAAQKLDQALTLVFNGLAHLRSVREITK